MLRPRRRLVSRLLTVDETADQLAVSVPMVRKMLAQGDLTPVHVGRSVRVREDEVRDLIDRQTPGFVGKAGKPVTPDLAKFIRSSVAELFDEMRARLDPQIEHIEQQIRELKHEVIR